MSWQCDGVGREGGCPGCSDCITIIPRWVNLERSDPGGMTAEELLTMLTYEHPGTEDFVMLFSDESGEDRPSGQMEKFIAELRRVAGEHGFDINMWGTRSQMTNALGRPMAVFALEEALETLRQKEQEAKDNPPRNLGEGDDVQAPG